MEFQTEINIFKENLKKNRRLSYFIHCSLCLIISISFRGCIGILSISWCLYYILSFVKYAKSWDYVDYKLKKSFFKSKNNPNWIDLLLKIFYLNPRCYGFVLAYYFLKAIKIRKGGPKIHLSNAILNYSIGINARSLRIIQKIVSNNLLGGVNIRETLLNLPSIILFEISFDNPLLSISKKLRLYKENWELKFNPNSGCILVEEASLRVLKIQSKGTNKGVWHFLLNRGPIEGSGMGTYMQLTGRPIRGMQYFEIATDNYKFARSAIVYNMIYDNAQIQQSFNRKILENIGVCDIYSKEALLSTHEIFCGVKKSGGVLFDKNKEFRAWDTKSSIAEFILKEKDNLNFDYRTIKWMEKAAGRIERLSTLESDLLVEEITGRTIRVDLVKKEWESVSTTGSKSLASIFTKEVAIWGESLDD